MTYPYHSELRLGQLVLNVQNLSLMTAFYRDMIGLKVLSQTEEMTVFTFDGHEGMFSLIQTNSTQEVMYGLYHTAFLLPDRNTLGQVLRHLLEKGVPLTGGADHGYSEAIYLNDPEGNGIELYRDRPVQDWDIRPDGQILGITIELDAQSLLDQAPKTSLPYQLPETSQIGHVHLSVQNAQKTSALYAKIFPMTEKAAVTGASFMSSGGYHHHLAFNQWQGIHLAKRQAGSPGLNHLTIHIPDPILFQASLKKASLYGMKLIDSSKEAFLMEDPNGIRTRVRLSD